MATKGLIKLSYVDLDRKGNIVFSHLEELLKANRRSFVSLMHANNEIGNLLPIKAVGEMCKTYDSIFHSDTVQTIAHYNFDLQELPIHFLTGAAHKFHGPKGNGFLYINADITIKLLFQEVVKRGICVPVLRMFMESLDYLKLWMFLTVT